MMDERSQFNQTLLKLQIVNLSINIQNSNYLIYIFIFKYRDSLL